MFAYCGNNPAASFDHYGTYATAIGFGRSDECVWGAAGGGGIVGIGLLTWLCQILSTESRGNQTTIKEAGDGATSVSGGAIPQAANQKAQLPSSKKITINMDHILSGHSAGGNRGGPRKSRFPSWMTAAMIERAIRIAYENAEKAGAIQYSWQEGVETARQFFRGFFEGMEIDFWFNYTKKMIETAWPK